MLIKSWDQYRVSPRKGFSPRNGEIILKFGMIPINTWICCFSPHNGEVVINELTYQPSLTLQARFSPRSGEIILKLLGRTWSCHAPSMFQSHRWGSNSKAEGDTLWSIVKEFHSPQWGLIIKIIYMPSHIRN